MDKGTIAVVIVLTILVLYSIYKVSIDSIKFYINCKRETKHIEKLREANDVRKD